ncbi:MAG: hypothetical protein K9L30_18010 [Desulfobacterales bacterium]|nr:hypothetical protein [Desulfobacterales bacterium]
MYRSKAKQFEFESFNLPFGGKLRSDNRWVQLAKLIPWEDIEQLYIKSLSNGYSARFRPPIPEHSGHLFRNKSATHSGVFRPPCNTG